jgi:cytochrome c
MNIYIYCFALLSIVYGCNNKKTEEYNKDTNKELNLNEEDVDQTQISVSEFKKGADLINSNDCLACHKFDEKLVGPSYKEIAAKYTTKDTETLVNTIINGGSGNWGEIPMAAHSNLSKEDATAMVNYILSLK